MPRLSVWFVRCALAYLTLGFTFGALMLLEKGVPVYPPLLRLLPAHIEFVLFGWTAQLAMGIAFWILPRFASGASRQSGELAPRGNEKAAWLAFGLLNAGIWLAGMGPVLDLAPALPLLGRACEAIAHQLFKARKARGVLMPQATHVPAGPGGPSRRQMTKLPGKVLMDDEHPHRTRPARPVRST